jgi:osmotically-inducible protein OsmY
MFIDDFVITIRGKAAIFENPLLETPQITVETFKWVVQLNGFVEAGAERQKSRRGRRWRSRCRLGEG